MTFSLSFTVVIGPASILGFFTHGLNFFPYLVAGGCPLVPAKRFYSSASYTRTTRERVGLIVEQKSKEQQNLKFDPLFVTGFTDAEGCFHVSVTENKKLKLG